VKRYFCKSGPDHTVNAILTVNDMPYCKLMKISESWCDVFTLYCIIVYLVTCKTATGSALTRFTVITTTISNIIIIIIIIISCVLLSPAGPSTSSLFSQSFKLLVIVQFCPAFYVIKPRPPESSVRFLPSVLPCNKVGALSTLNPRST